MDTTKQINTKNRTFYFYNDIIDIGNFDSKLLKIDKKQYKHIYIFNMVICILLLKDVLCNTNNN